MSTEMMEQKLAEIEQRLAVVEARSTSSVRNEKSQMSLEIVSAPGQPMKQFIILSPPDQGSLRLAFEEGNRISEGTGWSQKLNYLLRKALSVTLSSEVAVQSETASPVVSQFQEPFESNISPEAAPPFKRKPKDSWEKLFGWSKNDTLLREAARSGAAWREQMNREGKQSDDGCP